MMRMTVLMISLCLNIIQEKMPPPPQYLKQCKTNETRFVPNVTHWVLFPYDINERFRLSTGGYGLSRDIGFNIYSVVNDVAYSSHKRLSHNYVQYIQSPVREDLKRRIRKN